MAEPFKNLFNETFYNAFIPIVKKFVPSFDGKGFLKKIFDADWDNRELKARARHTTIVLKEHMYNEYPKNVEAILQMIRHIRESKKLKPGIESLFFPDFIEYYGIDDYQTSIRAMEEITKYFSCEFAIRPFILKYPERVMNQMLIWSKHENPQVRRLSTEGCRPRLPWAMSLPFLKKDPTAILPILENLKDDEAETVRRSVANNLNDIARDNPEVVIGLVKKWKGLSKNTDWVVKHGSRTLLKQANEEALKIFGFASSKEIKIENLKIITPNVKIGSSLQFSCDLVNSGHADLPVRLEYGLYYLLANGRHSRKVYRISERHYPAHSTTRINRKQSFKIITTRRFYPGLHKLTVICNGKETSTKEFQLKI